MKFTCSTKPLQSALKLGVIKSNISKFYQKSCLAKVTCSKDTLRVNLEASRIMTQLTLHGSGDEDGPVGIFVDCQKLVVFFFVLLSFFLNVFFVKLTNN